MELALEQLDISTNAAELYLKMLDHTYLPASEIAKFSGESRTYTYALLEELARNNMVEEDDSSPVKKFQAAHPRVIDDLLQKKQEEIAQKRAVSQPALKSLSRRFDLAHNKPGVASGIGLEYFDATLKAMEQSNSPILIFGSNDSPQNKAAFDQLLRRIYRRKRKGLESKILFHDGPHQAELTKEFKNRGFEFKFIGCEPFEGEVVIYQDTLVFTSYLPKLVTTTITDRAITNTLRTVFNLLWESA